MTGRNALSATQAAGTPVPAATTRPVGGYGLWECVLRVEGREYYGGGHSASEAEYRARLKWEAERG